jgi:YD repeat-containing protein
VAWPNRVQSQYTYDAAARLESIQHQLAGNAFTAIEYAYDQNGNRNQETLTQGSETRITHYQYVSSPKKQTGIKYRLLAN